MVRELRRQAVPVRSEIPLEGATAWLDAWSLVSTASHPGCAYRFLDYATKASVQAKTSRLVGAAPAAPGACRLLGISTCRALGYVPVRDFERLRFAFREEGGAWRVLPEQFDASILSDEATAPGNPNFTGAFVGMAAQDMAGTALPADFDWFEYRERPYQP